MCAFRNSIIYDKNNIIGRIGSGAKHSMQQTYFIIIVNRSIIIIIMICVWLQSIMNLMSESMIVNRICIILTTFP